MAEDGLLAIPEQTTQDGSRANGSVRDMFGNPPTTRISTDIWPSADLNAENAERKKFMRLGLGEIISNRMQPAHIQGLSSSQSGEGGFDYQKETQNLEKLSADLDSVRQQLIADILRCQLLQVDLATQFDPGLVKQLRACKLSCEKCDTNLEEFATNGVRKE